MIRFRLARSPYIGPVLERSLRFVNPACFSILRWFAKSPAFRSKRVVYIESALPSPWRRQPPAPSIPICAPPEGGAMDRERTDGSRQSPENSNLPRTRISREFASPAFPQLSLAPSCAILQQPARRRRAPIGRDRPPPLAIWVSAMASLPKFDLADIKRRMQGAHATLKQELGGLRTGRASVGLLEPVQIEAYGQRMPINQVASISVPEPRALPSRFGTRPWFRRSTKRSATPISA